jgi:hypothetical protein
MKVQSFAALAVSAALFGVGCGSGDEPPPCDDDLCVTSTSSQRAEARFAVDGIRGTAGLELTDHAIEASIATADGDLLRATAVRSPTHYEATLVLDGVSLDDAHAGDPDATAALAEFTTSADAAVVRHVLDRLQGALEPRDSTADLGQLAGALQIGLDETDAFVHGGDVEYGPPSGSSCLVCIYLDKGCFCISCTLPPQS